MVNAILPSILPTSKIAEGGITSLIVNNQNTCEIVAAYFSYLKRTDSEEKLRSIKPYGGALILDERQAIATMIRNPTIQNLQKHVGVGNTKIDGGRLIEAINTLMVAVHNEQHELRTLGYDLKGVKVLPEKLRVFNKEKSKKGVVPEKLRVLITFKENKAGKFLAVPLGLSASLKSGDINPVIVDEDLPQDKLHKSISKQVHESNPRAVAYKFIQGMNPHRLAIEKRTEGHREYRGQAKQYEMLSGLQRDQSPRFLKVAAALGLLS